jgi:2,4-dienoyl-CoA reductase-like NADH-dependent reductase (Old Yellow Enzyme family)
MKTKTYESQHFPCGISMKNRLMLAPLTNLQSHTDGTLSEAEMHWLAMRAQGGFGLTMTAAAHVQPVGQGFPGQLGAFDDSHIPGLTEMARRIRAENSVALMQLHHGGMRSMPAVNDFPRVAPSADEATGSRALTTAEVRQVCADFIAGAVRAQRAGFDGVELHAAHNYLICQFLSAEFNRRDDEYGGSLENRSRLLFDIIDGIRQQCGPGFLLGVRLTTERNGILLAEAIATFKALVACQKIDFIDLSLWDVFKEPVEAEWQGRPLLAYFTELERGAVKVGAAGKIYSAAAVQHCLDAGCDFVLLGRAAVLHHDFPRQMQANPDFAMMPLPASRAHLRGEGLSEGFIDYVAANWPAFVEQATAPVPA